MNVTEEITLTADQIHLITPEQAWYYRIIPKGKNGPIFFFYCDEASDTNQLGPEVEIVLGKEISLLSVSSDQISMLLSKYYLRNSDNDQVNNSLGGNNGKVDFLTSLISEAKNLQSSDIHIEIYEYKCRIRIRIDGMLVERYKLIKDEYPALVNQIKIFANLDIAEKRLPQDGRINFKNENLQFDIRVSVLPTLYGEKIVLRLLNNDAADIDLENLGFSGFDLDNYLQGIKRPNGIVLISGPTGSGKTTTLYATIKLLNKDTRNILTIEDPVEYTLQGVNQVQLKDAIGLGFAEALRTFLRQDPDVIMVGEIRDTETANMAIRAALTGHLVLSTIHTNSAWGTVSRLIDMGVPSFLVANTLNTTVAQRLIRLLCPECKLRASFTNSLYPRQFKPYEEVTWHYLANGCEKCHYTGYKGRKAVYEVILIDGELSNEIKNNNLDIKASLVNRNIFTLAKNAFELFSAGLTSLDEIYPLLFNY